MTRRSSRRSSRKRRNVKRVSQPRVFQAIDAYVSHNLPVRLNGFFFGYLEDDLFGEKTDPKKVYSRIMS